MRPRRETSLALLHCSWLLVIVIIILFISLASKVNIDLGSGFGSWSWILVIKTTFTFIIIAGHPGPIPVSLMLMSMLILILMLMLTWLPFHHPHFRASRANTSLTLDRDQHQDGEALAGELVPLLLLLLPSGFQPLSFLMLSKKDEKFNCKRRRKPS